MKPDTLINIRIKAGDIEGVKSILETHPRRINMRGRGRAGLTPLHQAVRSGQTDIVRFLVDEGADITLLSQGMSPLLSAARAGSIDITKILAKHYDTSLEILYNCIMDDRVPDEIKELLEEEVQSRYRFAKSDPECAVALNLWPECPITKDPMRDPVQTVDGHTYDRVVIERWLKSNARSPLTNMNLDSTELRPNLALKAVIIKARSMIDSSYRKKNAPELSRSSARQDRTNMSDSSSRFFDSGNVSQQSRKEVREVKSQSANKPR